MTTIDASTITKSEFDSLYVGTTELARFLEVPPQNIISLEMCQHLPKSVRIINSYYPRQTVFYKRCDVNWELLAKRKDKQTSDAVKLLVKRGYQVVKSTGN